MTRNSISLMLGAIVISFLVSLCSGSFILGQKLPKDPRPLIADLIPGTPQTITYKGREVMKTLCDKAGVHISKPPSSGKPPTTSEGRMRFQLCKIQNGKSVQITASLDPNPNGMELTRHELNISDEDILQLHYWSEPGVTSSANK